MSLRCLTGIPLEQISASAAKKPGKPGPVRRFRCRWVIPPLAQGDPTHLFRPRGRHGSVDSGALLSKQVTTQAAFYCREFLKSGSRGRREQRVTCLLSDAHLGGRSLGLACV